MNLSRGKGAENPHTPDYKDQKVVKFAICVTESKLEEEEVESVLHTVESPPYSPLPHLIY
jgi:hypothetical protein